MRTAANSGNTMNGRKMLTMPIRSPASVKIRRTGSETSPDASRSRFTTPLLRRRIVQPNVLTITLTVSGNSSAASSVSCNRGPLRASANAAG